MGGPEAQMDLHTPSRWVSLLLMFIGYRYLQDPSSIAGSMQPSESHRVSCHMSLIHLPDSRPSPQKDEVAWLFYQGQDSSPGTDQAPFLAAHTASFLWFLIFLISRLALSTLTQNSFHPRGSRRVLGEHLQSPFG